MSSIHEPAAAAQRTVITLPIEKGLISLRGLSPQRLRFELEYAPVSYTHLTLPTKA